MDYTDDLIMHLLSCPKHVTKRPQKDMKKDGGQWKNGFEVVSDDGLYRFSVFIRYNDAFNENFSVGLIYHPQDEPGAIHLLRCNGPHGETRAGGHHDSTHIHIASADAINAGKKSDSGIETTAAYASWQEALIYFIKRVNIRDAEKYFPPVQSGLFDGQ